MTGEVRGLWAITVAPLVLVACSESQAPGDEGNRTLDGSVTDGSGDHTLPIVRRDGGSNQKTRLDAAVDSSAVGRPPDAGVNDAAIDNGLPDAGHIRAADATAPDATAPYSLVWDAAAPTNGVCALDHWCWKFPTIGDAYSAVWASADDDVWAVGVPIADGNYFDSGGIIHYDGHGWRGISATKDSDLDLVPAGVAIAGSAKNDVWVLSTGTRAFHFDGTRWTFRRAGHSGQTHLSVVSPTNAWAVGGKGDVSHWDGIQWDPVDVGSTDNFCGVTAFSSTDVWIGGQKGAYHWDGAQLTLTQPAGSGQGYCVFQALTGTNIYWGYYDSSDLRLLTLFHYDGAWTAVNTNGDAFDQYTAQLTPDLNGGVLGWGWWNTGSPEDSATVSFSGATSKVLDTGGPAPSYYINEERPVVNALVATSPNKFVGVGLRGYQYQASGPVWTFDATHALWKPLQPASVTECDPRGEKCDNSTSWPVPHFVSNDVAYYQSYSFAAGTPYFDGSSWTSFNPILKTAYGIDGSSPTDVWAGGPKGALSHWDGASWKTSTIGTTDFDVWGFWNRAPKDVWTLGRCVTGAASCTAGAISSFHYDGSGWSAEALPAAGARWIHGVSDWLVGASSAAHWTGSTWQTTPYPSGFGSVVALRSDSATAAVAMGCVSGVATVIRWDGLSWSVASTSDDGGGCWDTAAWASPTQAFGIGIDDYGSGIVRHFDGGAWSNKFDGFLGGGVLPPQAFTTTPSGLAIGISTNGMMTEYRL